MTRHALLALIGMMLALWAFARACNPPHPAESGARSTIYAPWVAPAQAPTPCDYRRDVWPCWVATMTAAAAGTPMPTPTRASATWGPAYPEPRVGVWSWVDVAVARADDAGKPTAGATATRTGTPTPTRPPRPTRTARPTGTPTQGRMASPVPCGPGTVEPGLWTPWPACYPHGPSFTPTPVETDTPTPSDTPPATATWEPTPTAAILEGPAPRVVPLPEVWVYRFPMLLVWRRR